MAKFGKERFPERYQSAVGMSASERLHQNSRELVEILKRADIVKAGFNVFELGAGPCRNLHYINESFENINLFASDLYESASRQYMSEEINKKVTFFEGDSENVINNLAIRPDLLIVSDHFMHLQYEKVENIINTIVTEIRPSYILIRELRKEFETPEHPRLFHKSYETFLYSYDVIHEDLSKQDNAYFIKLLKRK